MKYAKIMKLFPKLMICKGGILYVYITWLLALLILRKEIVLTKTDQSLWALPKLASLCELLAKLASLCVA